MYQKFEMSVCTTYNQLQAATLYKMSPTLTKEMLVKTFWADVESRPDFDDEKDYAREMPDFDSDEMDFKDQQHWSNLAIKHGILKVKHGGTFYWLGFSYRNQELLIYHKDLGVCDTYNVIDDYGSIIPELRVGEDGFAPNHWCNENSDAYIDHNTIIFLSDELVRFIRKNLVKDGEEYTCAVTIYGRTYKAIVEDPENLTPAFGLEDEQGNFTDGTVLRAIDMTCTFERRRDAKRWAAQVM